MVKNELTIEIARPVNDVFAFVDDDEKVKQWIGGLVDSRRTSKGRVGVGTTFEQLIRIGGKTISMEGILTAYEPNQRLSVKIYCSLCNMEVDYRFEERDGITRVNYICNSQYNSFFYKLLSPLTKLITQRKLETDFFKLKQLLEDDPTITRHESLVLAK